MADESRNFQVEIITPERVFYTGEATMIEFTSVEGDMGVYKNHIPLTTALAPGIVTITEEDGQKKAAVRLSLSPSRTARKSGKSICPTCANAA